jgi:hypothetical protein
MRFNVVVNTHCHELLILTDEVNNETVHYKYPVAVGPSKIAWNKKARGLT